MIEDPYKRKLNPEQYRVMRQGGVETAYTGKYWDNEKSGTYSCAFCGNRLFSSNDKFDSKTGWPTFYKSIDALSLEYKKTPDSEGNIEVRCKKCHSHIGRLVRGEKEYYRAYSIALNFEEKADRVAVLEDVKGKLEEVKDRLDEQNQNPSSADTSTLDTSVSWVSRFAQILGGGLVGVAIGAIGAYLLCRATCAAPITSIPTAATTTTLIATSTPKIPARNATSTTPRAATSASNTGTVPSTPLPAVGTSSATSSTP